MFAYITLMLAAHSTVHPSLQNVQQGIMREGTSFNEYHLLLVTVAVKLLDIRTPVDSLILFPFSYRFVDFHYFYGCLYFTRLLAGQQNEKSGKAPLCNT
jgi:hypothetical protein